MKLMCVDYGRKRIGVAVTDPGGLCVRGLSTIIFNSKKDPHAELVALIAAEAPHKLVFGIPLDENDNETGMAREIRIFAESLEKRLSIPIEYIDESYSSKRATVLMMSRKKKQRRDKKNVDRIAACIILEEYLRNHS